MIIDGHPNIWPCYKCGERKKVDYMTLAPTGQWDNPIDYVCDDCQHVTRFTDGEPVVTDASGMVVLKEDREAF